MFMTNSQIIFKGHHLTPLAFLDIFALKNSVNSVCSQFYYLS